MEGKVRMEGEYFSLVSKVFHWLSVPSGPWEPKVNQTSGSDPPKAMLLSISLGCHHLIQL
jgi:hypothetical protein